MKQTNKQTNLGLSDCCETGFSSCQRSQQGVECWLYASLLWIIPLFLSWQTFRNWASRKFVCKSIGFWWHETHSSAAETTVLSITQWWGGSHNDGVAQFVECLTRDRKTRGSKPVCVRSTGTICASFSLSQKCADSLSVCPPALVCIRMHKNDQVRTYALFSCGLILVQLKRNDFQFR